MLQSGIQNETNRQRINRQEEIIDNLSQKLKEEASMHEYCMTEYRLEMNKVINQLNNREKELLDEMVALQQ